MKTENYRIICGNRGCGYNGMRRHQVSEYERLAYPNGYPCPQCGLKAAVMKSKWNIRDGFKPGLQRNIMKVCHTVQEYEAWKRKLGIIEVGYEDFEIEMPPEKLGIWDDDMIKFLVDKGLDISGREVEALKREELLKDYRPHITDIDDKFED